MAVDSIGRLLFRLKDTHGFPLDMGIEESRKHGMPIDWDGVVEEARVCGWWDFKIYEVIDHALVDCGDPNQKFILSCIRKYIVSNPHLKMLDTPA